MPGVREPRGLTREGADTWGSPGARRRRQASRETCQVKQGRHWAMSGVGNDWLGCLGGKTSSSCWTVNGGTVLAAWGHGHMWQVGELPYRPTQTPDVAEVPLVLLPKVWISCSPL